MSENEIDIEKQKFNNVIMALETAIKVSAYKEVTILGTL